MPDGSLKLAAAPVPSALPLTPAVPASVVTTPAGVILRMGWKRPAARKTVHVAARATTHKKRKVAAAPVPPVLLYTRTFRPRGLKADGGSILRMVWLWVPAT